VITIYPQVRDMSQLDSSTSKQSAPPETGSEDSSTDLFVGRERELQELTVGLEAAVSGRGRLFLLAGEPGIGKTRLAAEIAAKAFKRGAEVLWGRCWEGGGAPAYWPWVQVIRGHAQACEKPELARQMGNGAPLVAEIAREVRDLFPDLPEPVHPADSEEARFRLFDAVGVLLANASQSRPLTLVLDDLHWADEPSLLLLQFLARGLGSSRILMVGTYRNVEANLIGNLSAKIGALSSDADVIPLRGLSATDIGLMIEHNQGRTVSERLLTAVHRATDGNPLFVGELIRLFASEGRLHGEDLSAGLPIPDRVREVVHRRLHLVSQECQRLLRIAAVIGRDFDSSLLQDLCHLPKERIFELASEAQDAGLIADTPGPLGRFSFVHDVIKETVYAGLSYTERIGLHQAIAETIEKLYREDLDTRVAKLAYHYFQAAHAGVAERAADYSTRAGDAAAQQLAYEEAAVHYDRALRALDLARSTDNRRRSRLWLALGNARWWAGRLQDSRVAYWNAAETAEKVGAPNELARAAMGFGGWGAHGTGRDDDRVIGLLERALQCLGQEHSALRASVMARLAVALAFSKQRERSVVLAQSAVDMARRVGDKSVLNLVLNMSSFATWSPDNLEQRLEASEESVRLISELGASAIAAGSGYRAIHLLEAGDIDAAEIEEERRSPHVLRCRFCSIFKTAQHNRNALLKGRFEEIEALAFRVLATLDELQNDNAKQLPMAQLFMLRREETRLGEIVEQIQQLAERYLMLPFWRATLAWAYAELGRELQARQELNRLAVRHFADIPRDLLWLGCIAVLSEVVTLLGDIDRAEPLYQLLSPFAGRYVIALSVCFGSAARSLGRLATALSRYDDAVEHFERALKANERLGSPPWVAHTQYDYARMLTERGDTSNREKALALLGKAEKAARELGMKSLAEKAQALRISAGLTRSGVESGRIVPPAKVSGLFRREGEYWTLAYQGTRVRMKEAKGLRYIATLLRDPGREFYAGDLLGSAGEPAAGDLGPILDSSARAAYKNRIEELEDELQEAEANNDAGRLEKARAEIDSIAQALSSAAGLGARKRLPGSSSERARLTVTKAIKASLLRIDREHPALGRLLASTIRTGIFCSYRPDPRWPVIWTF
jgi:tetratricopeptide (TPR) repeat protein